VFVFFLDTLMDIAPPPPPPSCSKKKLKQKRYKEKKRQKKIQARTKAKEEAEAKAVLHQRLKTRLNQLKSTRTGQLQARAKTAVSENPNMRKGTVNPRKLMERLGLTDPGVQQQVLGLIQSGQLRDMNTLVSKIKQLSTACST